MPFNLSNELENCAKWSTSLATGTRPWTVVTTDHTSVDMLRTTVSETPARSGKE